MSRTRWTTGELKDAGQAFLNALVVSAEQKAEAKGITDPTAKLAWIKQYLHGLGLKFDAKGKLQEKP